MKLKSETNNSLIILVFTLILLVIFLLLMALAFIFRDELKSVGIIIHDPFAEEVLEPSSETSLPELFTEETRLYISMSLFIGFLGSISLLIFHYVSGHETAKYFISWLVRFILTAVVLYFILSQNKVNMKEHLWRILVLSLMVNNLMDAGVVGEVTGRLPFLFMLIVAVGGLVLLHCLGMSLT